MNLLVGLTVNKIDELSKTGEKIQAFKRVEDIVGMAKILYQSQIEKYLGRKFCFDAWMFWMPERIMLRLKRKKSTKVCVTIPIKRSKFFGIREECYDLHHYIDNKMDEKIHGGQISAKNVQKAREALKAHQAERDEFQYKLSTIKRDSNEFFINMMENLGNKANREHCKRHFSKTERLPYDSMTNIQNELQDVKKTLDTILQALSKPNCDLKV